MSLESIYLTMYERGEDINHGARHGELRKIDVRVETGEYPVPFVSVDFISPWQTPDVLISWQVMRQIQLTPSMEDTVVNTVGELPISEQMTLLIVMQEFARQLEEVFHVKLDLSVAMNTMSGVLVARLK